MKKEEDQKEKEEVPNTLDSYFILLATKPLKVNNNNWCHATDFRFSVFLLDVSRKILLSIVSVLGSEL
jgi:hypothetical protein